MLKRNKTINMWMRRREEKMAAKRDGGGRLLREIKTEENKKRKRKKKRKVRRERARDKVLVCGWFLSGLVKGFLFANELRMIEPGNPKLRLTVAIFVDVTIKANTRAFVKRKKNSMPYCRHIFCCYNTQTNTRGFVGSTEG